MKYEVFTAMYDARAIANFFLSRAVDKSVSLTTMTLLKVMYFAHAWYLVKFDKPLVAQPFEAWEYGPVCRLVYQQLRGHGDKPIHTRLKLFNAVDGRFVDASCDLNIEEEVFLGNIFDYYSQYHAFRLSDLTHIDGSPWHIIWEKSKHSAVPGMIIPDKEIKKWFREEGRENPRRAKGNH